MKLLVVLLALVALVTAISVRQSEGKYRTLVAQPFKFNACGNNYSSIHCLSCVRCVRVRWQGVGFDRFDSLLSLVLHPRLALPFRGLGSISLAIYDLFFVDGAKGAVVTALNVAPSPIVRHLFIFVELFIKE